ncbi:MAG: DUF485 domain-containing protein [Methylophilales bacterium]|nr:DUF485 domain-containing protein [Methylophilales bacterium]
MGIPTEKAGIITNIDWCAVEATPSFQRLHKVKMRFLWSLLLLAAIYYFLLPIGTAYFQDVLRIKVWGVLNVGIVFALSQFVVVGIIAVAYVKFANRVFDPMAQALCGEAHKLLHHE